MSGWGASRPEFVLCFVFLLGTVIGSFLNVVIHRLPKGESIVWPGSRCPACGRAIRPSENIPLLSYVLLRGRCRGCGGRISLRYPAVELATGLVFAALVLRYGLVPMTPVWFAFAAALIAAALIDFDHRFIPDRISLGGLVVALVAVPIVHTLGGTPVSNAFARTLAGAVLGSGLLWSVGFVHARISVALGRTFEHWPGEGEAPPRPSSVDYWVWFPGLGFGDVKLMAMVGAVLGPVGVVETIIVASLAGLVGGLVWVLAIRKVSAPFGFGPAIAAGALVVVLVPHPLLFVG